MLLCRRDHNFDRLRGGLRIFGQQAMVLLNFTNDVSFSFCFGLQ